jgi:ABC-type branched-subunit amino acid transport system ATPase component/branched-subunit amino acid ABC-type transport system permease component
VTTVLDYAILGIAVGALYVPLALGLVLIRQGSGVINFAQGAIGMAMAYLYWVLHDTHGLSFAVSFCITMVTAVVLGVVIQWGVMRPLRHQSPLTRMLATIGIIITLTAGVSLLYPEASESVNPSLPSGTFTVAGITVAWANLWILVGSIVLTVLLQVLYRGTRFGIATRAVTENRLLASSVAINPDAVAAANWALGCMLASATGIFLAPITGLTVEGITLLVIPALAAAVAAKFQSFPLTLLAALALGVIQTEVQRFVNSGAAWSDAVPFFVLLILLVVRGSYLPVKGELVMRLPRTGTGRIRIWAVVLATGLAIVAIEVLPYNWVAGIITTLVAGLVVLSVVVVTGYAGQLSLAQFALAGIGAWVASRLVATTGAPFPVALLAGLAAALPVGLAVGLPALRTRGENLAIATLGLAVAAASLIFSNLSLTGGAVGTDVGTPSFFGINLSTVVQPQNYALFVLVCFVLACLVVANLRRSATGRRMLAIRADERAAASLGINAVRTKLYAFAVSSVIAALGGILLVFENPSVNYGVFDPLSSVDYVGWAVIGGVGFNAAGPISGATLSPGALGANVADLFSATVQNYLMLAAGIILILTLIANSNGIASVMTQQWRAIFRYTRRVLGPRANEYLNKLERYSITGMPRLGEIPELRRLEHPKRLHIKNLSVKFGASTILSDVSLEVTPGEIVGLIGPNGAGKTTLIDSVTGFNRPSGGSIGLDDVSLLTLPAWQRAVLGVGRSFQGLQLFNDMTVAENLMTASGGASVLSGVRDLVHPGRPALGSGALAGIAHFGLDKVLTRLPGELPYGQRSLVAIARALAREPAVLLLDEPAAGLSESERGQLSGLLRDLATSRDVGILLVEHDIDLVLRTCDRVVVLNFGRIIASGTPDEIRTSDAVAKAYLGGAGSTEPDALASP